MYCNNSRLLVLANVIQSGYYETRIEGASISFGVGRLFFRIALGIKMKNNDMSANLETHAAVAGIHERRT